MSSDSNALEKLISAGSDGLCPSLDVPAIDGGLQQLWNLLLRSKNGFYAYESALLVRPLSAQSNVLGVIEWNSADGWKGEYNLDLSAHLFFAENIFGEQFSFTSDGIFYFEPETAKLERIAANLGAWAALIAADPSLHLGHALARKWQSINGPLQPGERLGPKTPFVLGGEFVPDNLARMRDTALMSFRAQLANQIADLPDGAEVRIDLIK